MYVLASDRTRLLDCLPKGGTVAEIGVAKGDFSEQIFRQTQPMTLHLVDPWEHQEIEDYANDPNNVAQEEAERRYRQVCSRFEPLIEAEVIRLHRQFSSQAANEFPDEYLDWAYIDGLHTYEGCLSDLQLLAPKVKSTGFICGHDYANHIGALHRKFGVVEAVNQFVRETGYHFLLLTHEPFPSYVIAKTQDHELCETVVTNAFVHCGIISEIKHPETKRYEQVMYQLANGAKRIFYSFD